MRQRYNSVLTPLAQNVKQCSPGTTQLSAEDIDYPDLESKKTELGSYYFVALIQSRSAARISEVLAIDFRDILLPDRVLIRGQKGSRNQIVSVPEMAQLLRKCVEFRFNPFKNLNRFAAYRTYKKAGIHYSKGFGKKASVTHAFRHTLADELRNKGFDEKVLQDSLSHNSQKTQMHYGKKHKK